MQPGLDLGKDKIPRRARHIERPKAFLAAAGQDNLLGRLLSAYLSAVYRTILAQPRGRFLAGLAFLPSLHATADEAIE